MTNQEERLNILERRLTAAEDEVAIIRLIASYGPFVDSGNPDLAPTLFTAHGVFDVGSSGEKMHPDAFRKMLAADPYQSFVKNGIVHVIGLPFVRVNGDKATAINSTQVFQAADNGYVIYRISYNFWKLERTDGGWKVRERVNRPIGTEEDAVEKLNKWLA